MTAAVETRAPRTLALAARFAAFALALGAGGGCGGVRPPDPELRYALRGDLLVVATPSEAPAGSYLPGQLDAGLAEMAKLPGAAAFDPAGLTPDVAAAIESELARSFGTPAAPNLPWPASDSASGEVWAARLAPERLARGAALYGSQCANCHGVNGDGRGSGAAYRDPLPRDFRRGLFKCADGGPKPTWGRLTRLITEGIPGSGMPPFDLFSADDCDAVLAYVVHLSVRGEAEFALMRETLDPERGLDAGGVSEFAAKEIGRSAHAWRSAQAGDFGFVASTYDAEPARSRRGASVYLSAAVGCASCHGADGKGGALRYDAWGTVVRPANLTLPLGERRWGRLPGDVRGGIAASGMPGQPSLTDAELNDLVGFVDTLGAGRLPADVKTRLTLPAN